MNITFVSRSLPIPGRDGSGEHTYNFLTELGKTLPEGGKIAFIYFGNEPFDYPQEFKKLPPNLVWIRPAHQNRPQFYDSPALDTECHFVRDFVASTKPDVVIVDYQQLARIFQFLPQEVCKTLFLHDLRTRIIEGFESKGFYHQHYDWTPTDETFFLQQPDVILTCDNQDTQIIQRKFPEKKIIQVGIAAELKFQPPAYQKGRILYVGSWVHENVIAVNWFLRMVWEKVLERYSEAQFIVCGNVGHAIEPKPKVQITGPISEEQLTNEYRRANLCIIPHISEGGMKLKMVGALAHGKPIVASNHGISGFPEAVGTAALVTDDPEQFASSILWVINSGTEYESMSQHTREIATARFTPEAAYGQFFNHLSSLPRSLENV